MYSATVGKSFFSFIEKYEPESAYILNENLYGSLKAGKTSIRFAYHPDAAVLM